MTRAPAGGTARRVPVRCAGAHARAVPALLRRARRTLGVLVLALTTSLALLPPAPAQARSVSVSNITQAALAIGQTLFQNEALATAFTTGGSSTDRYTLNSVILDLDNVGSGSLDVSIHNAGTGSNANNPGTKIGNSLTGSVGSGGNRTYTASGITLVGGTTYFVRVLWPGPGDGRRLNITLSDTETGSTGWSIANTGRYYNGTSWVANLDSTVLKFTINATAQSTTVSPPTVGVPAAVTYGSVTANRVGNAILGRIPNVTTPFAGGTALAISGVGPVTCATSTTAEVGWYRSTALTTKLGSINAARTLSYTPTAPGEYRALAYCKSGSTYSSAVNLMRGGAVTLTAPTLRASAVTQTTATLTRSHFTGTWYYKADKAPHTACSAAQTGNTAALTGLSAGTSYTYRAYSDSTCTTELTTATTRARFTAQRAVATLRADAITRTGARLTIGNHSGAWWHQGYRTCRRGTAYFHCLPTACTAVASGTARAILTGLTPDAAYTWKAYSNGSCATELTTDATDADFTAAVQPGAAVTVGLSAPAPAPGCTASATGGACVAGGRHADADGDAGAGARAGRGPSRCCWSGTMPSAATWAI